MEVTRVVAMEAAGLAVATVVAVKEPMRVVCSVEVEMVADSVAEAMAAVAAAAAG